MTCLIINVILRNMKKILSVMLAVFLFTGTTMAQFDRGNLFVNANVSEVSLSFGGTTTFSMGAYGGYFLADHLALIGGLDFFAFKDYSSFNIAGGVRYYFLETSNGGLFASGLMDIGKSKDVDATVGLRFNGGYAFLLNQHVALEPMATLRLPFADGADVTFTLGAGISVYF